MAHYAFLDENNVVVAVIVGIDETELIEGLDPETWYGNFRNMNCKRTSYNANIRKNFAGIGFTYDSILDGFIPPKLIESWILDEATCKWIPPVPKPDQIKEWFWDNQLQSWVENLDKETKE